MIEDEQPSGRTCTHGAPEGNYCHQCRLETMPQCGACKRHAILNFHCRHCAARFCSRYCMEIIHPWSSCTPRVPCAMCGVLPVAGGKPHQNHALWCEVYKLLKSADKVCATIDGAIEAEGRDAAELGKLLAGVTR